MEEEPLTSPSSSPAPSSPVPEEKIGPYRLERSLGKGGMGEVFLAFDTECSRYVALKRIRPDLVKYPSILARFLSEAKIAARLSHPSIISIFSISDSGKSSYYTMPFIEGDTLLRIIHNKKRPPSIPSLMRLFLSVCQAIAYAHTKGILHRDLKPENIIIGKFGEVMILDWGLAEVIGSQEEDAPLPLLSEPNLTRPGKIVGTLAYLSPERALGAKASIASDVYSLSVILYLILTLKLPFKRGDLKTFQKLWQQEELVGPEEMAPHRAIPSRLAEIVEKGLHKEPCKRYQSAQELIWELEAFVEGKPEWILSKELDIHRKVDWEFQENVLITKYLAIAPETSSMEWVSLMISKEAFAGNTKIELLLKLEEGSEGVGILLNAHEPMKRKELTEGYSLFLGQKSKLFHSNVEVASLDAFSLTIGIEHKVVIEKRGETLLFSLDDTAFFPYASHSPLSGAHLGLFSKDDHFAITAFRVYTSSQNLSVSCLAIPDAFLAAREFDRALTEYRHIGSSFSGRSEGHEAIFRSGLTLIEKGLSQKKGKKRLFTAALEEFGKLSGSAGAILEYLGKAIAYQAMGETDEECKCLELALRRYPNHPLRERLIEHITFRLHESAGSDRKAAYLIALLCLSHLPHLFAAHDNHELLSNLTANLEGDDPIIALAFLLDKPYTLAEIDLPDAQFALLKMGKASLIKFPLTEEVSHALKKEGPYTQRVEEWLATLALDSKDFGSVTEKTPLPYLRKLLWLGETEKAKALLERYPLEEKLSDTSPLFSLYGCYLLLHRGAEEALRHFSLSLKTPYPSRYALLAQFLAGNLDLKKGWGKQAFTWEKRRLFRDLALFYHCAGDDAKSQLFLKKML